MIFITPLLCGRYFATMKKNQDFKIMKKLFVVKQRLATFLQCNDKVRNNALQIGVAYKFK
jgi:hypothetical protein